MLYHQSADHEMHLHGQTPSTRGDALISQHLPLQYYRWHIPYLATTSLVHFASVLLQGGRNRT